MQIQTYTHTRPRPIVYHVCTRNTLGTTPYSPSSITFTFSPASISCPSILPSFLSFESLCLSFGRSPPPLPRSHVGGRVADQTCNNMPASPPLVSPFTPSFCLPRSFCVRPSIHHPSTLLVISIDLAGAMAMRVCGPPPAIIRQAPIHRRRPLCACVSHDRLYICFCAPGQLCLGLDCVCRILNAILLRAFTRTRLSFARLSQGIAHAEHVITLNKGAAGACTPAASR